MVRPSGPMSGLTLSHTGSWTISPVYRISDSFICFLSDHRGYLFWAQRGLCARRLFSNVGHDEREGSASPNGEQLEPIRGNGYRCPLRSHFQTRDDRSRPDHMMFGRTPPAPSALRDTTMMVLRVSRPTLNRTVQTIRRSEDGDGKQKPL